MKEQEQENDPYWKQDRELGEGTFYQNEPYTIRMKLHSSLERFRGHNELVKLEHRSGERTYVHAKPYILEPQIILTIGLHPQPDQEGAIGRVEASDWTGMRSREIGNAQAWYYHQDQLLVLWECYLFDFARTEDPRNDPKLTTVWTGFEQTLLEQFPDTQRVVTPSWEDLYVRNHWRAFLRQQGYGPFNPQTFLKEVAN